MAPNDAEKPSLIPLPATEPPPNRRKSLSRRLILVFCALAVLLGLNTLVHNTKYGGQTNIPPHRSKHHSLTLKEREELFLSVPNADSAIAASRVYATHPHLAGSSEDFNDAKVILKLFQTEFNIPTPSAEPIFSAGSPESRNATLLLSSRVTIEPSAWIDIYYPVLNTPLSQSLQIIGDEGSAVWTADLAEDGDPLDEDAHNHKNAVPPWHGLSKHGEAEGQLVYANYGTKEDYDDLVSAGTNLTGKIVITRYGHLFRGLKIKRAEELGAVAVLIYSDPRDDGFVTVKNGFAPYPAGPARNPTSVQRGSVQYLSFYPGDPTTPGYPAYKDADREEPSNIPTIPSLPISWKNAERLLEEIGDLYFVAEGGQIKLSGKASESNIKIVNHVDTKVTPIWNTMASIPGHIRDEVVIIGCHRDAWVLGAADPISGTVSLHEVIRGFGALLRKGWKPLRTVVFASWDAEEYGLIGSTEWGEDFAEWLSQYAVAYLNVDVSVSGSRWRASGSPSLAHLIKQVALDVVHPTVEGKTLWDARNDQGPFTELQGLPYNMTIDAEFWEAYTAKQLEEETLSTGVSPLGSGSDFTVFLQRLGIASSDQGFGVTSTDAVYHYHSIYDSQRFQETYADPGFHRHVAVAKHLGLLALRLTDSIIVPLNTTQYALELDNYLDKAQALAAETPSIRAVNFSPLRKAIKKLQRASRHLDKEKQKAEKRFKKALRNVVRPHGKCGKSHRFLRGIADWIKKMFGVEPHRHEPITYLNPWPTYLEGETVSPDSIYSYHRRSAIKKLIKAAKRVAKANRKIIAFERGFISEGGIKDREWYKHLGVAPGKWLGYGATTFPALTEAITIERNATLVALEAGRLTGLLKNLAHKIRP